MPFFKVTIPLLFVPAFNIYDNHFIAKISLLYEKIINMDDNNLRGIPVKCYQVTVKKRKQIIKSEQLKLNTRVHFIYFLINLYLLNRLP